LQAFSAEPYESQEEYKSLFEQAPDAVVVIDELNNVVFWNPKAEAVFGWPAQEAIGNPISDLIIPPNYRHAHNTGMQRYLVTRESNVLNRTIEVPAINKEGLEFMIALTIAQTKLNGKASFIAFIRDITREYKDREALALKTHQLEQSNSNLEEFAYAASHDLKEPIRKIKFFSERLKFSLKDQLNEDQVSIFNRIDSAALRMGSLVDDLLTYSQVAFDDQAFENVDLNKLMQVVLEDMELEIEEKKAEVLVDDLFVIKGHFRQLQQAFQNLISNAVKYSKPGIKPQIAVTCSIIEKHAGLSFQSVDPQKPYYCLSIIDNGIGFNEEDAERIFNVFTRLHGNAEYKGSGIGLSIVRKVIENHNGYITASGVVGEGAVFKIYFPAT
jgi:PAS domain S-box-containing protein